MISKTLREKIMRSKVTVLLMLIILCVPNVSAAIDSQDGGGDSGFHATT